MACWAQEGEARTLWAVQPGEYRGCAVIRRAVWPLFVVVRAPESKFSARIRQRMEPANIQAFIAQAPVEALDVAVLDRSAGTNETEPDLAVESSALQRFAGEFTSVITGDADRRPAALEARLR